jgi:hypothetical protein
MFPSTLLPFLALALLPLASAQKVVQMAEGGPVPPPAPTGTVPAAAVTATPAAPAATGGESAAASVAAVPALTASAQLSVVTMPPVYGPPEMTTMTEPEAPAVYPTAMPTGDGSGGA